MSREQSNLRCRLDASPFAACSAPVVFNGLSAGSHSFSVLAVGAGAELETRTVWWEVDVDAPAVTLTGPRDAAVNSSFQVPRPISSRGSEPRMRFVWASGRMGLDMLASARAVAGMRCGAVSSITRVDPSHWPHSA